MRVRALLWIAAVTSAAVGSTATPAVAIVGGSTAPSVPYLVQVFDDRPGQGDVFQCGGTLVAKSWVLTAQHCLADEGETTVVRVGSTELLGGTRIAVDRTETPPKSGDVALLHLVDEVDATPVRLAADNPPFDAVATMYGWGAERVPDPGQRPVMSPVLKQATTTVSGNTDRDGFRGPGLTTTSVGGTGAGLQGDSGGPLLVDGVQVGVISRALGDGSASASNVHARVADHRQWIRAITEAVDGGPATDANVALNSTATSRERPCTPEQTAAKVVDGRAGAPQDKWCSDDGDLKTLEIDLGANRHLKRIVIKHAGAGGESTALNTTNFVLLASAEGGAWRTADVVLDNTASTTTSTVNLTARFIRFVTADNVVNIYEIEAYTF
jgi:hypothetical protein